MNLDKGWLELAQAFANKVSDCSKVKVGTAIVRNNGYWLGANITTPHFCESVEKCNVDGHCVNTIHSEIHAIVKAGTDLNGATAYVTRYPCEACARALAIAGISRIVYGRKPEVSETVKAICKEFNIKLVHVPSFDPEAE